MINFWVYFNQKCSQLFNSSYNWCYDVILNETFLCISGSSDMELRPAFHPLTSAQCSQEGSRVLQETDRAATCSGVTQISPPGPFFELWGAALMEQAGTL